MVFGKLSGRLSSKKYFPVSSYRNDFQIVPHDAKLALGFLLEKAKHLFFPFSISDFFVRGQLEINPCLGAAGNLTN
jgi:hypothetical protein